MAADYPEMAPAFVLALPEVAPDRPRARLPGSSPTWSPRASRPSRDRRILKLDGKQVRNRNEFDHGEGRFGPVGSRAPRLRRRSASANDRAPARRTGAAQSVDAAPGDATFGRQGEAAGPAARKSAPREEDQRHRRLRDPRHRRSDHSHEFHARDRGDRPFGSTQGGPGPGGAVPAREYAGAAGTAPRCRERTKSGGSRATRGARSESGRRGDCDLDRTHERSEVRRCRRPRYLRTGGDPKRTAAAGLEAAFGGRTRRSSSASRMRPSCWRSWAPRPRESSPA